MSANDDEINRREVAWRLFASEFRDADFSYAESDEERAPNYVVTPTGARVNRLFVVGVLTEVEYVSDDYLRARIVDPTGAFVVYAGQYQPEALTFLENAETPTFVAVTGKARTFQPDDSDVVYTSIRPEAISEVDAASRDNWVVTTAEQTLERVATMADALDLVERGDDLRAVLEARHVPQGLAAGIPLAIDHYGTTEHYLAAIRDVSLDAARVVAGERDEVEQYRIDPGETGDEPVDLGLDAFTLVTGDAQPVTPTESASDTEPAADAQAVEEPPTTGDAEAEAEAEPASESETEAETEAEPESEPEPETATEPEPDSKPTDEADGDATADSEAEAAPDDADEDAAEAVDTDEMYELSEEERQEVEENYDVEFSTADEVEGKAGIEPEAPQPDVETDTAEPAASDEGAPDEETAEDLAFDADTDEDAEVAAAELEADNEAEADEEPSDEESEGTDTENLENAVVETMQSLGDGAGADRDELVQTVMEEHGVDQDAVEDAIQDALMSGRCYESGDDELTAI